MKQDFYGRTIDLDETYFVVYHDTPRELSNNELADYTRIQNWPQRLRIQEMVKLDPLKNPSIHPVSGRELITICLAEQKFPVFDPYFDKDHANKYIAYNKKITLIPLEKYEFYAQYSKQLNP